jgi:hypothetical protein
MLKSPSIHLPFILILLLGGCTSLPPTDIGLVPEAAPAFNYIDYEQFLAAHVNDRGQVDYTRAIEQADSLERFYGWISTYSPDSHPRLFPTDRHRLAYWINAYNASVIKGVLEYYPIDSVADVKPPPLLFFFPDKSGFFLFQRFTYGGQETSLYYLENEVIRLRFQDPQFHFALNCASSSCPELPPEPFYPERLDQQLDREARKFINDERNVRFDPLTRTLHLSSIFNWYEEDFTGWLKAQGASAEPTLVDYVLRYLEQPARDALAEQSDIAIQFFEYDWGLNDSRDG